jgi:transcriptional regulator with XRE-family HTH domain
VSEKKPDKFLLDLGNRIRKVRESKGFTVQDACDKADVSRAQYYRIEGGQTNCTVSVIRNIAEAFEMSISELMDY